MAQASLTDRTTAPVGVVQGRQTTSNCACDWGTCQDDTRGACHKLPAATKLQNALDPMKQSVDVAAKMTFSAAVAKELGIDTTHTKWTSIKIHRQHFNPEFLTTASGRTGDSVLAFPLFTFFSLRLAAHSNFVPQSSRLLLSPRQLVKCCDLVVTLPSRPLGVWIRCLACIL